MRFFRILPILVSVCLTSCIPIPYAYPTLDVTPKFKAEAPANEVKAIRVDVKEFKSGGPLCWDETRSFKSISLKTDAEVDSQYLPGIRYGAFWHLIALDYSWYTRHQVQVCLYRPGYRSIQIKSEDDASSMRWTQATTLQEQEIAIDQVHLSRWKLRRMETSADPRTPEDKIGSVLPGSDSPDHRDVLIFLANEYERLTFELPKGADLERLTSKANALRARAAE